ncbi:MAG: hypothetical protein M3N57_11320 [Actinomycetota bacterium]|nr:hypothetical protein [Actinomycetota bacterium]
MAIGASYFGNRILRHVEADMEDLASRGFTAVLHTMSENDLNYYPLQMGRLVAAAHDVGLEVQIGPWGVGHAFGGEAESLFTASHPELGQVFDNDRRVGAACLNRNAFRELVKRWADTAVETGADRIFWDEPHWAHPERFGLDEDRWACRCGACRARFREEHGGDMPRELTDEVVAFRERCLVEFVRELVAHVSSRGGRSTVCLLPLVEGSLGLRDWAAVATADGLDTIATDPYWKVFGQPASAFVARFARKVRDLAAAHHLTPQIWIQGFGLGPEDRDDIHAAVRAARAEGVDDIWTWGYEACGHMDYLATRDPEAVWDALTAALTGEERDG